MALKDVTPGEYVARPTSWGLEEVEKLQQIKAVINFEFTANGQPEKIKWDGFLTKKDGDINKKTLDTLLACGFNSKSIIDLQKDTALNTQKDVVITIIQDGEYHRVEWVNSTGGKIEKVDVKKLQGMNLSKIDGYLSQNKKEIPNKAPGANPPVFDPDDSEVPF